jgi:hypothetical protein
LVGWGAGSHFLQSHSCWGSDFTLDSWYLYFGLRWSVGPLVYGSTTSAIVCTKLCTTKSTDFLWYPDFCLHSEIYIFGFPCFHYVCFAGTQCSKASYSNKRSTTTGKWS